MFHAGAFAKLSEGIQQRDNHHGRHPLHEKLRFSDPDFKVILKLNDGESSKAAQKIYLMYSPVLAGLSKFVDTALSVQMKEKEKGEITLENVTPELFEKALSFLQDPVACCSMTTKDALDVFPFYHMYEFAGGIMLCDHTLSESIVEEETDDLNQLIGIMAMAYTYDLPKAKKEGLSCFNDNVLSRDDDPIRAAMLTPEHIQLLLPMFKEGLLTLPSCISKKDFDTPVFPAYFVKCMACRFFGGKTQKTTTLRLEGTDDLLGNESAEFKWVNGEWAYRYYSITKGKDGGLDWRITEKRYLSPPSAVVLWKCHKSKDLDIPPPGPWEAVSSIMMSTSPVLTFG